MRYIFSFLTFFLFISGIPFSLHADQAYVTDSLEISIRRGPTTAHKILRFIQSGHPVKILEENDGWAHIETFDVEENTTSGWVLSRFLTRKIPHQEQARQLTEENRSLKSQFEQTHAAWENAEQERQDLKQALLENSTLLDQTQKNLEQLTRESAGYLLIKEKAELLEKERDTLLHENIVLRAQARNQALLIGGGLVFSGLFLGFFWGRRQKRYSGRLL